MTPKAPSCYYEVVKIVEQIKQIWQKTPSELRYILKLFLATRIALILIGYIAFWYISKIYTPSDIVLHWPYPKEPWLKMWAVWDSGWYLDIAQHGYTTVPRLAGHLQANIGFFPLYPILMRAFGWFVGSNFIAGLVLSNLFLLIAAYLLFLLAKIRFGEKIAKKVITFLFLFPTAFVLSGVNPESLFLLLSVSCFYFAEKEQWGYVGLSGFLLGLTKPTAILIILPLLILHSFKQKNIRSLLNPRLLFLLCIPAGMIVFAFYCKYLTGDFLAYVHMQQVAWHHQLTNPVMTFYSSAAGNKINAAFDSWFAMIALLLIAFKIKKIPVAYWLYTFLLCFSIASNGEVFGILRYLASSFPLFFALALLSNNDDQNNMITYPLVLLQGALFIFWTSGFWFIS